MTELPDVEHFGLLIIGAGSGNTLPPADEAGPTTAIIDDGAHFGGTCLNVGCIPTKMFVHVADVVRNARDAERLGVHDVRLRPSWPEVRDRVFGRIDHISESGEHYRESGNPRVTLVRERVEMLGDREVVTASGRRLSADTLVIAAGSRARRHDVVPLDSPLVHTSDTIMRVDDVPRRLAIIGGGSIASEFAHVFNAFGSEVTQLVRGRVLSSLDADVAATFTDAARERWRLETDTAVVGFSEEGGVATLTTSAGEQIEVDAVLVAIGRIPNTDTLGTYEVGFDHHDDGRLRVDAYQRVLRDGHQVPGVFALGDIDSDHQLKHVANHEARVVAHNIAVEPGRRLMKNTLGPVPDVVFTEPQIASFGVTLERAEQLGYDAFEVVHEYGSTAWGWALEDKRSFCKLVIARGSATILGAHIVGPDAAVLLQPLVLASSFGHSIRGLARGQYWPHPAASEVVENALLRAEEEL